jgi:hypothetical protein
MPHKRTILRDLRDDARLATRFWKKVAISEPLFCWEWTAYRGPNVPGRNYGKVGVDGAVRFAHRVAWVLTHGPVPDGMDVLHRCDNPPCCNPAHLFLGTHLDNMRDRSAKGRRVSTIGESNPKARLNADDVLKIRARWRAGERPAESIAADYPVTKENVYAIVFYRSWKHVP